MATHPDIRLLLDNIRSVHNVGSIFRTAECAGVSRIYLVGATPAPVDRFGRKRKDLAKVALGAEDLVKWEHISRPANVIARLRAQGFKIVAVEQAPGSIHFNKISLKRKVLLILGNEVAGVSRSVLRKSDAIAEIPLRGKKESLNVSVAAGIALFAMKLSR
jgi:tRNA G18 (ribose-2'-O)-methylase SpoU